MKTSYDIIIVGGGILGQIMGLASAQIGCKIAIIDSRNMHTPSKDGRAFALAASSLRMLDRLGVEFRADIQPIKNIIVTDGDKESPWKLFLEDEYKHEIIASMIESKILYEHVHRAACSESNIQWFSNHYVKDWQFKASESAVTLKNNKTLTSALTVAADGRNSQTRQSACIETKTKSYEQSAIVTTISHSMDHHGKAVQRFLKGGPLAILPLTGKRSQIVWSNTTETTRAALALSDDNFIALLAENIGMNLGEITLNAQRQSYPLINQLAETMALERLVLIGDAAHVIHPLAGQGLNLGLRDIAALSHCIDRSHSLGQDIGIATLQDYQKWRQADTQIMSLFTNGLNTLYQTPSSAVTHLRKAGLSFINQTQFLKSFILDEAAGNTGELPDLMKV